MKRLVTTALVCLSVASVVAGPALAAKPGEVSNEPARLVATPKARGLIDALQLDRRGDGVRRATRLG